MNNYKNHQFFDNYHLEIISTTDKMNFSKKEESKKDNKYVFKVLKNEKDSFIKEIISKGCNIESITLNKFKLGDHFLDLEGG